MLFARLTWLPSFHVVVRTNPRPEADRIRSRIEGLARELTLAGASFWSDIDKGVILAILQDQVDQVVSLVELCYQRLAHIFTTMEEMNEAPPNIHLLLAQYRPEDQRVSRILQRRVWMGATIAYACVRVHHPEININSVHEGLPVDMKAHYIAVQGPANNIISIAEAEATRARQARQRRN